MFYRHIVFDLDGTLIDSRQDLADAANAMLATYGAPPLAVPSIVAMIGEGARLLVTRALTAAGVDADPDAALPRFLDAYDQRLTATTRLYDGVAETLARLRDDDARVSVLTNKPQRATDAILASLGVAPSIDTAIGGDTPYGRKPDPAALHALMVQANVPANQTLMVGDSWVDVSTASAAGIDACLVTYGFGFAAVDDDHRGRARFAIDSIGALLTLPSSDA